MELVATEREKAICEKNKEIAGLVKQVAEYRTRLDNVLGDISGKNKEVIHLSDSLETLKKVNTSLVMELEGNNKIKNNEEKTNNHDTKAYVEGSMHDNLGHKRNRNSKQHQSFLKRIRIKGCS